MTNARDKANIPVLNFQSKGIDDNADATAITIDSGENVGIGTTSMSAKLHIVRTDVGALNDGNSNGIMIEDTNCGICIGSATTGEGHIYFSDSNDADVGGISYFHSDNALKIRVNASERVRIDSSGNFLVGTTVNNPYTSNVNGVSIRGSNTSMQISKDGNASLLLNRKSSDGQIIQLGKDGSAVGVLGTQNWGIGTSAPGYPLQINSSSQTTLLHLNSTAGTSSAITFANTGSNDSITIGAENDDLKLRTDDGVIKFFTNENSEKMRIDSLGSLGLGTSSPFNSRPGSFTISNETPTIYMEDTNGTGAKVGQLLYQNAELSYSTGSRNGTGTSSSTEYFRINSSGKVGIGTSSPSSYYANHLVVDIGSTAQSGITIVADSSNQAMLAFADGTSGDTRYRGYLDYNHSNDSLAFATAGSEVMRITSTGLGIGTSSPSGKLDVNVDNSGTAVRAFNILPYGNSTGMYNGVQIATDSARSFMGLFRQTTASSSHIKFYNTNGSIGSIKTSGTSTSFNTSSDHRLKENISYDFDATTRLKQLKPARFNFIKDADKTLDGFIAHEVQSIVPEAVHGTHNETETKQKVVVNSDDLVIAENIEQADWETGKIADEDGNTQYPTDSTWKATKVVPVYQGIDQSKLVPLLVKTIQELEARITTLEANNP